MLDVGAELIDGIGDGAVDTEGLEVAVGGAVTGALVGDTVGRSDGADVGENVGVIEGR